MRRVPIALLLLASLAACHRSHGPTRWRLVHHETFDRPFDEPAAWTEDTYGDKSPYHVDAFDEDGAFFVERGGEAFTRALAAFRSFRKSYRYGDKGWLTVELYGRDEDRDGHPESGGRFEAVNGHARLVSARHTDGAILRSTEALPSRYRVEVTVSNIHFGGKTGASWQDGSKLNGMDGPESAGPWRFKDRSTEPLPASAENGVYFLCIADYARPAPHNNVFIHHHRKVVMDTDNNVDEWSMVWDPATGHAEPSGSHYVSMIWLDGSDFGGDWTGNAFVSWAGGTWHKDATFVDEYLPDESYVFTIERDADRYTLSVTGKFARGGQTTYVASRGFRDTPPIWHYNQRADEYPELGWNQQREIGGKKVDTWPPGSTYPDYFFFGDPHINYYEGTAEYDDVKLYLPE